MSESRATVGVLLTGIALIATVLAWPDELFASAIGVLVPAMAALAGLTFLAFSGRRHGYLATRWMLSLTAIGGIGLAGTGGLAFMYAAPNSIQRIAIGVAALLGLAATGLGAAEYRDLPREAVGTGSRYILYAVALGFGGLVLAGVLGGLPGFLAGMDTVMAFGLGQLGMGIGFVLATIGFFVLTGRGVRYLDIVRPDRRDLAYMLGGTVGIVVAALVVQTLLLELGVEFAEHSTVQQLAEDEGVALLVLAIVFAFVTNGFGEELLYRNGVQKYLTEWFTPAVAILVSSVIFAAIHVPAYADADPIATAASLLVVFVLSIVLGVAYYRTDNVLVPVVIHGSYNALLWVLVYV